MSKKEKKFADDGWAIWVDGYDTSTVYINNWLNPKGKNYVDLAVRIQGVKECKRLCVYVPFAIENNEIEDVSLHFQDRKVLKATFETACIIDYKKNEHTSEVAYNGKTVDIVHISTLEYELKKLAEGTLITIDLEKIHSYLDNDECYFIWRMPQKSLDEIFKTRVNVENVVTRIRDLITTPVVSEKYGYSIRINEARLLPEEITKIGAFHRQKLHKVIITLSIEEEFELNDGECYRIRRLEENLYKDFLPKDYKRDDIITYQWSKEREDNMPGQFNFYYNLAKNSVSKTSMFFYMVLLLFINVIADLVYDIVKSALGWFA